MVADRKSTQELRNHIHALVRAFHITLFEMPDLPDTYSGILVRYIGLNPETAKRKAVIQIRPVVDHHTYAIALHEIGHFVAPNGQCFGEKKLISEEAAWEWARYAALEWTPEMDAAEARGLASYQTGAKLPRWGEFMP